MAASDGHEVHFAGNEYEGISYVPRCNKYQVPQRRKTMRKKYEKY
jgi:hypothetical protein